jgi:hypothetical protein
MRWTPSITLTAALAVLAAAPARGQDQPAQSVQSQQAQTRPAQGQAAGPAAASAQARASAERRAAELAVQHAELDIRTAEERLAEAEREAKSAHDGGDLDWKREATRRAGAARDRLVQARADLAHRALDLEAARRAEEATREGLIDVDFKGGAVAQYVEALAKAAQPTPVNVILADGLEAAAMQALRLRGVTVETAVRAIPSAAKGTDADWTIQPISAGPGSAPVYRVQVGGATTMSPGPGESQADVVSLARAIDAGVPVQTVISAVDTALGVQGAGQPQPPDLKLHGDSGLLIVRGTPGQLNIVRSTVAHLVDEAERRRTQTAQRVMQSLEQQEAIRKAEFELQRALSDVKLAEAQAADYQRAGERGALPAGELLRVQEALDQAKARVGMAEFRLVSARQRAEIQEQLAGPDGGQGARPAEPRAGSQDLEALREENRRLKAQLDEMRAMMETLKSQLGAARGGDQPQRRGNDPGRP